MQVLAGTMVDSNNAFINNCYGEENYHSLATNQQI